MQLQDLVGRIAPVAGDPIHVGWLEQAEVVVVPQRAYRRLRQPRHRADPVHGSYLTS